ncbi:hypothetical protein SAMN03080615_01642 [Amphritea atlantica]|uniref:Uncharacterized protein n=1 Tax=Amphritea atlantica TaxID=355243 RepID=A0A1H9GES4_9GAMM|nr:hypothetical protein [Amphritea atlantica]SEQ48625.1 hypothetical protein SAMN03080615_01642 [Amphritea atlantica]
MIIDLALYSGVDVDVSGVDDAELETVVCLADCHPEGLENDDGVIEHFNLVMYFEECPEEGVIPLGNPLDSPVKKVVSSKSVLMSAENPSGFKLEDLLQQLQVEVNAKHQKILSDDSDISRRVQANNLKILECLAEAERLQRDSYAQLAEIAPDAGPEGKARIGGE